MKESVTAKFMRWVGLLNVLLGLFGHLLGMPTADATYSIVTGLAMWLLWLITQVLERNA